MNNAFRFVFQNSVKTYYAHNLLKKGKILKAKDDQCINEMGLKFNECRFGTCIDICTIENFEHYSLSYLSF